MSLDTVVFAALIVICLAGRLILRERGSGSWRLIHETLLILPMVLLYFLIRGLVNADAELAFANAERVIAFERSLDIFHEPAMQRFSIDLPLVTDAMNVVYVWGHWPVIGGVLAWLILQRPDTFPRYRNALLLSGTLAMCVFALFPVAPPRLTDGYGFIDTIVQDSQAYRVLQPPSLANPYAAMPSLHFGWDLLMGIILVREASSRVVRLVGVTLPLAMYAAIVLTANHFLLDGLVGGALVVSSLLIVSQLPAIARGARTAVTRIPWTLVPAPGGPAAGRSAQAERITATQPGLTRR